MRPLHTKMQSGQETPVREDINFPEIVEKQFAGY